MAIEHEVFDVSHLVVDGHQVGRCHLCTHLYPGIKQDIREKVKYVDEALDLPIQKHFEQYMYSESVIIIKYDNIIVPNLLRSEIISSTKKHWL